MRSLYVSMYDMLFVIKISPWNTFLFFRKGQHRGAEGTRRRRVSVDVQYTVHTGGQRQTLAKPRGRDPVRQRGGLISNTGHCGNWTIGVKKLQHPLSEDRGKFCEDGHTNLQENTEEYDKSS